MSDDSPAFYDQWKALTPEDYMPLDRPEGCRDCDDDGPCPPCAWRYRRMHRRLDAHRQSEETCVRCECLFWIAGLVRRPFTCPACSGRPTEVTP